MDREMSTKMSLDLSGNGKHMVYDTGNCSPLMIKTIPHNLDFIVSTKTAEWRITIPDTWISKIWKAPFLQYTQV